MGKIFCVMGKSASGKDTIYNKILQDDSLMLSRIIPYTTRPIRDGETQDKDYHFCNEEDVKRLSAQGRIIELREYNTVYGVWKYFTVNDDDIDLRCKSYLTVGTLESYTKIRDYFGSDKVPFTGKRGSRCLNMRRGAAAFWQTRQIFPRRSCMRRVSHDAS